MRARRPRWTGIRLAIYGACAALATGCSAAIGPDANGAAPPGPDPGRPIPADALNPMGRFARGQDDLWNYVFPIAVVVFIGVFSAIAFIVFRFRSRGDEAELPKQVHGNTRLEIVWTLIPALTLAAIAVPTVGTIFQQQAAAADDALRIQVVAKQYWWEFTYLDHDVVTANELHIPVGREVELILDGTQPGVDVIHSYWVPSLSGKRDFVPGAIRLLLIEADEPGVYPGNCAEFCGLSHANMRTTVIAHEPADYEAWLAAQQEEAETPTEGLAAEGAEVFSQQCVGCHTVQGLEANAGARIGPDLTHFQSRAAFAGYTFDNTDENLRAWLDDPPAVKPGAQMPDLQLDEQQIDALIAYLRTLE